LNPGSSDNTIFLWYARKGALRAGRWNNPIADADVGNVSAAFGGITTASGNYSAAFGGITTSSGNYSAAFGYDTTASGSCSAALGHGTTALSYGSLAIGRYNVGGGTPASWIATDPLFEIGIGADSANKANALTVLKNGNVGIGTTSPIAQLHVNSAVVVGSPSGGNKGAGTINAQAVYDDNVLLTDYVFDKYFDGKVAKEDQEEHSDYQMKSLDEMIDFIQQERHLPTMTGREEWKQKGRASLGQLVNQLWETVETQALYIKQLKETADQQARKISALEQTIAQK